MIWAQSSRQLQIELGANQQVSSVASGVSYGEVLRAMQRKLGWEIEIPPLADELKLSYLLIESTQPQNCLGKAFGRQRTGLHIPAWSERIQQHEGVCDSFNPARS